MALASLHFGVLCSLSCKNLFYTCGLSFNIARTFVCYQVAVNSQALFRKISLCLRFDLYKNIKMYCDIINIISNIIEDHHSQSMVKVEPTVSGQNGT